MNLCYEGRECPACELQLQIEADEIDIRILKERIKYLESSLTLYTLENQL